MWSILRMKWHLKLAANELESCLGQLQTDGSNQDEWINAPHILEHILKMHGSSQLEHLQPLAS